VDTCFNKAIAGAGATTDKVSDALLPAPPFVEETAPLVFAYIPTLEPVISTVTVQVLPAATVPPLKLTLLTPAPAVSMPPHVFVVLAGVVLITPPGYVSEKAIPVRALFKFGLVMVKVSVEVPLVRIGFGANNFTMLGGFKTVSDAVAIPVEPVFVPPFVEETNPLTFGYVPAAVPIILILTVHELFAGMVAPVGDPNVRFVAPAVGAQVGVPPQVVVAIGVAATCRPVGNASVKVTPVKAMEFELESVKVRVEVPLTAMESGEKVFVMAGGFGTAQPVKVTSSKYKSEPGTELLALNA
jgi:hypothetical protein